MAFDDRWEELAASHFWPIIEVYKVVARPQGAPSGSVHPNRAGNAYYGRRIAEERKADFYEDGDLDLPRRPQ